MFADYDAEGVAEVLGFSSERDAASEGAGEVREAGRRTAGFDNLARQFVDRDDGAATVSPRLIEQAVEQGLPRQVLRHLAERIVGGDTAKAAALEWSIVPKTTLERRTRLSPQESERTERVARLFVKARRALGSEGEARVFITEPHPELDGRSPLEVARTDLGTRRAEQILNALEYGLVL